jgi:RNA polymerase sigma-70 factor (ECF subfamily)
MDADLEALRRHGFAVAYRMLGSVADAEDVVQEALLRLSRADGVHEPLAWMTTVTTRLAIDHLRLARVRRETYVGPWLPDPIVDESAPEPSARAELAESLSQAFLVMLEQLTPLERAAFLLREVFDYDYPDVARILDRSEASCRQLVARARRHLRDDHRRFDADTARHEELLDRFIGAAEEGDLDALEALLAEDAVVYADGGGKVAAARKPIRGAARVARFMAGVARLRRRSGDSRMTAATVNGRPGLVEVNAEGRPLTVFSADVADGRVQVLWIMRNPDKLAHIRLHVTAGEPTPSTGHEH